MKFFSTRDGAHKVSIEEALLAGLAPDGGLYVPELFPKINIEKAPLATHREFATYVLAPFFSGSSLERHLSNICEKAFSFEIPIKKLSPTLSVLELTHGPTCAFKDVGAQFLAATVPFLSVGANRPRLVLVATSGDTGGAVGCAFSGQPNTRVVILYPNGGISERQERQLTCWQENVKAYAVEGSFDDCQKLVKESFLDADLKSQWQLLSANSISLGRLLPQMIYYAFAAAKHAKENKSSETTVSALNFVIPTGNMGNALAAIWARKCGFPIGKIGLALNANRAIVDFFQTHNWSPQKSVATLANAMDVGNASNMERLRSLLTIDPTVENIISAISVSDEEIRSTIRAVFQQHQYISCPHTATAFFAAQKWGWKNAVVVATADPAKFESIVGPIIGESVPTPEALLQILDRALRRVKIAPNRQDLIGVLNAKNS